MIFQKKIVLNPILFLCTELSTFQPLCSMVMTQGLPQRLWRHNIRGFPCFSFSGAPAQSVGIPASWRPHDRIQFLNVQALFSEWGVGRGVGMLYIVGKLLKQSVESKCVFWDANLPALLFRLWLIRDRPIICTFFTILQSFYKIIGRSLKPRDDEGRIGVRGWVGRSKRTGRNGLSMSHLQILGSLWQWPNPID